MYLIGEKLNSSILRVREAMEWQNREFIADLIKIQYNCGTACLDINTAMTGKEKETENMLWIARLAAEITGGMADIMLDSPDPDVILDCLEALRDTGCKLIVNSVTAEPKYDILLEKLHSYGAAVVAMTWQTDIGALLDKLDFYRIGEVYLDIAVQAIAINENAAVTVLDTLKCIKSDYPRCKTLCGLSNISFGLPGRSNINAGFLFMLAAYGLDAAILDITNETVKNAVAVSDLLCGNDGGCQRYLSDSRQ